MPKFKQQISIRYLFRIRRKASIAAGLGLLSVLFAALIAYPQVMNSLELYQDWQGQKKQIQSLERKVSELAEIPQDDIRSRAETVNSVLPSRKPVLELLTSLNVVAKQAQVQFGEVSLSPGSIATESAKVDESLKKKVPKAVSNRAQSYDSFTLSLTATGDLAQITAFINLVEEVAPLTSVTKMSLSKRNQRIADGSSIEVFSAELSLTTYFFNQPVSAAIQAALPQISPEQQEILTEVSTYISPQISQQEQIIGGQDDVFNVGGTDFLDDLEAQGAFE